MKKSVALALLGLSSINPSEEEINIAYKSAMQLNHPDRHAGNERLRKHAEEQCKLINEAKQVLLNHSWTPAEEAQKGTCNYYQGRTYEADYQQPAYSAGSEKNKTTKGGPASSDSESKAASDTASTTKPVVTKMPRWQRWLRWILAYPTAIASILLASVLFGLLTLLNMDRWFMGETLTALVNIVDSNIAGPFICGFLFVYVSAKIAPSKKVTVAKVSLGMVILLCGIRLGLLVFVLVMSYGSGENLFSSSELLAYSALEVLWVAIAVGAAIYAVTKIGDDYPANK